MFDLSTTSVTAPQLAGAYTTIAHAGSDTALAPGQTVALQTEINTDPAGLGYKNSQGVLQGREQLCQLLNVGGYVANPVTVAPRLPLNTLTQGQILVISNTLEEAKAAAIAAGAPALSAEMDYVIDTLLPNVAKQDSLDMTMPTSQAMLQAISASGLLTADEITALTTEADPSWSPQVWEDGGISRVAPGHFVTPDDLASAGF